VDVRDGISDGGAAPADDSVRIWVQQDFGVDIATLTAVGHAADEASRLWRGVGAGGESYTVKLSGGGRRVARLTVWFALWRKNGARRVTACRPFLMKLTAWAGIFKLRTRPMWSRSVTKTLTSATC
jgi:hypothetical protein